MGNLPLLSSVLTVLWMRSRAAVIQNNYNVDPVLHEIALLVEQNGIFPNCLLAVVDYICGCTSFLRTGQFCSLL